MVPPAMSAAKRARLPEGKPSEERVNHIDGMEISHSLTSAEVADGRPARAASANGPHGMARRPDNRPGTGPCHATGMGGWVLEGILTQWAKIMSVHPFPA